MLDKEVKSQAIKAHELPRFFFYQVPQLLFYGKYRGCLSNNARLLYSIIWDRLRVAPTKGWIDREGFLFVRLGRKTAAFKLCIESHHTIQKCYEQLEDAGLIYRVRNGKTIVDDVYPLIPDDKQASKDAYEQQKIIEEEEEVVFTENPINNV